MAPASNLVRSAVLFLTVAVEATELLPIHPAMIPEATQLEPNYSCGCARLHRYNSTKTSISVANLTNSSPAVKEDTRCTVKCFELESVPGN
ncbi:hypothetical protein Mapa_001279 [Marchantia paleacea]|nr:hypothetical protein Mapa_001279 [Marchantia paleacea]